VKITRTTRDRVRLRRVGVVLTSVQGRSAGKIVMMFAASENYVREVIHAFQPARVRSVGPKWSGGPACKFASVARAPRFAVSPAAAAQQAGKTVHHLASHQTHRLLARAPSLDRVDRTV
jgi:hypothetical protein